MRRGRPCRRVIVPSIGSAKNGSLSSGLAVTWPTVVKSSRSEFAIGLPSRLVTMMLALRVRRSMSTSLRWMRRPPSHPIAPCDFGVSMVSIPCDQSRLISPVSDTTNSCPAGKKSRAVSVRAAACGFGNLGQADRQFALLDESPNRQTRLRARVLVIDGFAREIQAVGLLGFAHVPLPEHDRRGRRERGDRGIVPSGPGLGLLRLLHWSLQISVEHRSIPSLQGSDRRDVKRSDETIAVRIL